MSDTLCDILVETENLANLNEEMAREQQIAISDLLLDNSFKIIARENQTVPPGPYRLRVMLRERRLAFVLRTQKDMDIVEIQLSFSPFRQIFKDYYQICENHIDAMQKLSPSQIEAIDMARRGIHNEGAELLRERLEGKADIDIDTARRLFTLIYVLQFGASQI